MTPFLSLLLIWTSISRIPDTTALWREEEALRSMELILEDLLEEAPEEYAETLAERQAYRERPINLNNTDADRLRQLHILDEWQIQALLHYRESYGKIVRLEELTENVKGFSGKTLALLRPFVCLGESGERPASGGKNFGKHRMLARYGRTLALSKAYTEHKYAGSPDQYLLRYTFERQDRFRLGLAAKKGAGEAFGKQGFDSYAGYLAFRQGLLKNLVAGTYRIDWGFGLNVHTSGNFFGELSPDMLTANGQGIRPYASGAEYGYLQGVAAEIKLPRLWQAGFFYSNLKHDATLSAVPLNTAEENAFFDYVRAYPETGYHRTASEIAGKNAVRQQICGLNLEKAFASFHIGLILSAYQTGGIYTPDLRLSNFEQTVFSSLPPSHGANFSLYYRWLIKQLHFYGEAALSHSAAPSFLQGLQWKPSELFALSARYSYHAAGYYAAYAAVPNPRPPDRTHPGTEKHEFSWQGKISLPAGFRLDVSGKETIESRNQGFALRTSRIGATLSLNRRPFSCYLRFRNEHTKSRNGCSLRLNLAYRMPFGLLGESRLETRDFGKGMLLLQDLGYALASGFFQCRLRMALFQTQGYDHRIYAYEHDLLYAASSPALYGKGIRFCLLLKGNLPKGFTLELKYAHTLMDGVQSMASGDNLIQGFLKPEIKAQLQYKF